MLMQQPQGLQEQRERDCRSRQCLSVHSVCAAWWRECKLLRKSFTLSCRCLPGHSPRRHAEALKHGLTYMASWSEQTASTTCTRSKSSSDLPLQFRNVFNQTPATLASRQGACFPFGLIASHSTCNLRPGLHGEYQDTCN